MILARLIENSEKCLDTLEDLANHAEDVMSIFEIDSSDQLFIQDNQTETKRRIYSSILNKHGIENCFITGKERFSDESMDQTLAGKRVVFETNTIMREHLADRVKRKKNCGFHIGENIVSSQYYMLYNKHFDATMKKKIDLK